MTDRRRFVRSSWASIRRSKPLRNFPHRSHQEVRRFVDVENAGTKLFDFSGRLVLEIAPTGLTTLVSQSGHEEDLCAALS